MIDKSKVKKMYVWNKECDNKLKRYVVVKNSDGSCYAVDYPREGAWENNMTSPIALVPYLHCEEIPKDKYRPFKAEEITEEFFDYLFRRKGSTFITKITGISYIDNECIHINHNWISVFDLYDKWEMAKPTLLILSDVKIKKAYTDWMPAGVKE